MRQDFARDQDRAAHVDAEMQIDEIGGCLRKRRLTHQTGIVDEDIDAAQ
jgi:hypothetical protein